MSGIESLAEAARKVERMKYANPMNGDGHNYALDKVVAMLVQMGGDRVRDAAADERGAIQAARDAEWERVEAQNRAARSAMEEKP